MKYVYSACSQSMQAYNNNVIVPVTSVFGSLSYLWTCTQIERESHCNHVVLHMHMSKCTSNMESVSMSLNPVLHFCENMHMCRSALSAQKSCDVFATVLYNVLLNHALQFYAHVYTSVLGQKILLTNCVPLMAITESWS